jgi:Zn-dependent protease/predicted transcriptional regulator
MSWSFSIGTVLGSELRVHATFLLLLAWIETAAFASGGPIAALVNIAFVLALFACVVAHEFGHALMARRYGVRTPDITLLPIGGMARLEKIPEAPAQEIAVALAGPAVNIVIWGGLTLLFGAGDSLSALGAIDDTGEGFVARLAAINLFLAVFNMIPAFPMDGGRVLRAALAIGMDRVRATKIAATAGQAIAFGFGFLGLTSGNPLLLLIAIFVFLAAMAESSDVALHDLAKGFLARDAIITSYEALSPDASMKAAEAALLRTTQTEFPVIGPDQRIAGIVTKAAVVSNAQASHPKQLVEEAMVRDVASLKLTDPLEDALDLLQDADTPIVAVADKSGHFVGYITRQNIGEWMVLNQGRRR